MRPIYLSIVIIFSVYLTAQLTLVYWQKEEDVFSHIFTATSEAEVRPDLVHITLTRREPLAPSPGSAVMAVMRPINELTAKISAAAYKSPIILTTLSYQNSTAIAKAFDATQDVKFFLKDINQLPSLIETGINLGINVIFDARFSVSIKQMAAARLRAKEGAKDQILADAAIFATHLGRSLLGCSPPDGGFGVGFSEGEASLSGGISMVETPESEPISKFIRPLSELVIAEPEFAGAVKVAKTVLPPEVVISESEALNCKFK